MHRVLCWGVLVKTQEGEALRQINGVTFNSWGGDESGKSMTTTQAALALGLQAIVA